MFPFPFSFLGSVVPDVPVEQIANAEAMSFNGVDGYFTTNSIFSALDGLQKMTLSVWVKPTNLNFRHIITIASGTGNSNNLIRLATRDTGAYGGMLEQAVVTHLKQPQL